MFLDEKWESIEAVMEKIAIISDIHGNLEAFKTIIKDIEKRGINRIFCLGDIIGKGSHPHECIELVKKYCEVVLSGNNDDVFTANKANFSMQEVDLKRLEWNHTLLTQEDIRYLEDLPFSYEFYMSGSLVRLFHASPTKINGFCASYHNFNEKYDMFLPSPNTMSKEKADVVIFGHSHTTYVEKLFNRTLINVGSVGDNVCIIRSKIRDADPREITRASYLLLEGEFGSKEYDASFSYQFIDIPYNIDLELKEMKPSFESENYITELKEGQYRDMERVHNQLRKQGINPEQFNEY